MFDLDAAGEGTIDLALPLRADVPAGTVVTRSGRTGHYRITVTENMTGSVQYLVHADASYPVIEVVSQVLDIVAGDGGVLVDNSKLLL